MWVMYCNWLLGFDDGKVVVKECGRGLMRVMLRGKLNKIDVGIAARHAVTALEQEGKKVVATAPKVVDKRVEVEITYE